MQTTATETPMPTLAIVERLAGDSELDRGIGEWGLSYYSNNSDEVTKGKGVRRDEIRRAKQAWLAGRHTTAISQTAIGAVDSK
jgi:hypothetical protein